MGTFLSDYRHRYSRFILFKTIKYPLFKSPETLYLWAFLYQGYVDYEHYHNP